MGGVAYRKLGRTDEALREWDRGNWAGRATPDRHHRRPARFKSWINKAGTLCKLDRFADALNSYERATALLESSGYLRNNHAYAARLLMNKASALLHVDRFEHALEAR